MHYALPNHYMSSDNEGPLSSRLSCDYSLTIDSLLFPKIDLASLNRLKSSGLKRKDKSLSMFSKNKANAAASDMLVTTTPSAS